MNPQLKLLKIHKRRQIALKAQRAKVGAHSNVHIGIEIDDIEVQIKEIEDNLKRRLQGLRLQAASHGMNADPAISIEIEDIEEYFGDQDENDENQYV